MENSELNQSYIRSTVYLADLPKTTSYMDLSEYFESKYLVSKIIIRR